MLQGWLHRTKATSTTTPTLFKFSFLKLLMKTYKVISIHTLWVALVYKNTKKDMCVYCVDTVYIQQLMAGWNNTK